MAFDARHFAYWVGGNADWNNVDRDVLDRFARHACSCPRALGGRSKRGNGAVRRRNAARFLAYLVDQGAISRPPEEPELDERLTAYRSEEHTSELQSLMRISYAVFCLKKKTQEQNKKC